MAVYPELAGSLYTHQRPCPSQGGRLVDLAIFIRANGLIRVEAIVPIQDYRALFREDFAQRDADKAVQAWRSVYADLFGLDPLE